MRNPGDGDAVLKVIAEEPLLREGEIGLWVRVFLDAVLTLRTGGDGAAVARDFLFDETNPFFEGLANELGFDESRLRDMIKRDLERASRGQN